MGKRHQHHRSVTKKLKTVTRKTGHTVSKLGKVEQEFGEGFEKGGKIVMKVGGGMELVGAGLTFVGLGAVGVPLATVGAEAQAIGFEEVVAGQSMQTMGSLLEEGGDTLATMSKNKKNVKASHAKYLDATRASYSGNVPDWATKDNKLSHSKKHIVLVDKNSNDIHLSFKGTNPTHLPDLISDGHILLGNETSNARFREANETYKDVKEKYQDRQIHLSGHSLGATISNRVYNSNCGDNLSMVGFNQGSNPIIDANRRNDECSSGKVVQYTQLADPISMGVFVKKNQKVIVLPTKRGNDPHTLDNFSVA